MTLRHPLATAALGALALAILAWPSDALAWAPLAHLNFSAQALAALGPVPSALRSLLSEFGNEFLYGSLAADIVVGNLEAPIAVKGKEFTGKKFRFKVSPKVADALELTQPGFAVNAETGFQPLLMGRTVKEVPISWINRAPDMGVSSFRLVRVGGGYWRVLLQLARRTRFGTRAFIPGSSP